ncbi:MAG: hypothetical protein H6559_34900 [Lewinellaceae bacterium]|nr:hypothetical protein [Lewinellaceae bacterium]
MKTACFSLLLLAFVSYSCEEGAAALMQPTSPIGQPDTGCPYPEYSPPDTVPGTGCADPCQFVYEGWVGFGEGALMANCRRLPLSSPALSFSVDSALVREAGVGYQRVLRVRAPGIGPWCRGKMFFLAEGCPAPERLFFYVGGDGVSECRVAWPPGFWDCLQGRRINFRLVAQNPLAFDSGG